MGLKDIFNKNKKENIPDKSVGGLNQQESGDRHIGKPPYYLYDEGKARYFFEHRVLRDQFFENTRQLTGNIILNDGVIYDLTRIVAEHNGYQNPYAPSDFTLDVLRWNKDITMICIECPEPGYALLCYRIYMLFSDDFSNPGYYTVECGSKNNAFLCGWDKEKHLNFHEITAPPAWKGEERGIKKSMEGMIMIKLHAQRFGLKEEPEQ